MSNKNLQKIDNSGFLKKAIVEAKKWLRKIELADETAKRFYDLDMRLFQDWYNLTFSPVQEKITQAQAEYSRLIDLHNQSIYIANLKRIPLAFALIEIFAEEERYQKANDEEREAIDKIRNQRRRAIEAEVRRGEAMEEESSRRAYDEEDVFQEFRTARDFENLSDVEVREILEDEDAEKFIFKAFSILIPGRRADVLRRIWNLTPVPLQKKINRKLKVALGESAEQMIGDTEKISSDRSHSRSENTSKKKSSETPSTAKPKASPAADAKLLASKHFFRKIARRIHPDRLDLSSDPKMKEWFSTTWQTVISAHNREDAEQLRVLYHKILIVLDDYSDLDVSDIREAAASLKDEHNLIVRRSANLKNHSAWNFSKLKDFSKIEKREEKKFTDALRSITIEIAELREAHEELQEEAEYLQERMHAKKTRKRSNRGRRR